MSIIYSKDRDGVLHVALCGNVTRDPEIKENAKGDKVKFSVAYGKSKYMDCDAWADSNAGQVAGRLEKGDTVFAMGIHRSWNYNEKTYQSVSVDAVIPVGVMTMAASSLPDADAQPTASEVGSAGEWEELAEDDGDLPF